MSSYGIKLTKAYDLYRNSRVGIAMFDAIHELLEANLLNPQQALIIVTQFDFSIRRIMATKYSEQNLFSFEAEVKSYRLQPDWSVVLLENVAFYQHFHLNEFNCIETRRMKHHRVQFGFLTRSTMNF